MPGTITLLRSLVFVCVALGATVALAGAALADDQAELERVGTLIQQELEMKFSSPDDPGLYERRKRLRGLFAEIPRPYAARFATALEFEDRELSKLFRYKLATPTRNELLGILKSPLDEEKERYAEVQSELRAELAQLDPADPQLESRLDRLEILLWDIPGSLEHPFLEAVLLESTETGKLYSGKVDALEEADQGRLSAGILDDWTDAEAAIDEVFPKQS